MTNASGAFVTVELDKNFAVVSVEDGPPAGGQFH